MTKTPTKHLREEFIYKIVSLIGCNIEYHLTDGSGGEGTLEGYNPNTGEYYIIESSKIIIINKQNTLKIKIG